MAEQKKPHTTNYFNTFIEVADDTKADCGTPPPARNKKTIAAMQYDLMANHPYEFTSDDIIFQVHADRNDLTKASCKQARVQFFAKGQPCLRTSPLTKTYGFGIHCNSDGKVALYGMETEAYQSFLSDGSIRKVKAMQMAKR